MKSWIFALTLALPLSLQAQNWRLYVDNSNGEDVSVTLRTDDGDVHIEGETILSACMAGGTHHEFAPALQQAGVRYRWDGEESYGMMERSIPVDHLED